MILHTPYTIRSRRHNVLCGHVLCTLVAFLVASQLERTTVRAADDPLPKAEEILDQYVEVSGGKAAYEKLHNRATKGTLDFVTTGIKATVTTYSAEPDKMRTIIESPAIGKVEEGTDGEIAWELSLMTGPRIKEGDEKATTMRAAAFDSTVNWRKQYDKAECAGVETVEDKPCHKVILTPATGMPETHYYEQESGLLVKMNQTIKSPMGVIPVETEKNFADGRSSQASGRRSGCGSSVSSGTIWVSGRQSGADPVTGVLPPWSKQEIMIPRKSQASRQPTVSAARYVFGSIASPTPCHKFGSLCSSSMMIL